MRVVVRADSGKQIGFGHITRSLTLARALTERGAHVIAVGQGMENGRKLVPSFQSLDARDVPLASGTQAAHDLLNFRPDAVVVDGYHFEPDFFGTLESAGVPYGVVDDNGETRALAPNVVLNQNPSAGKELYSDFSNDPVLLLGLDFCLLRPEVIALAGEHRSQAGPILVSFGGTDALDLTVPVSLSLLQAGYDVAISERFREISTDNGYATRGGRLSYFYPEEFLPRLAISRLAVLGAGTSLWEASALGVPTVGVIVAENQEAPATKALDMGFVAYVVDARNRQPPREIVRTVANLIEHNEGAGGSGESLRVPLNGASRTARVFLDELSRQ